MSQMNSRERVIRTIERTCPDRVPLTHATLPGAAARYGQLLDELYRRYPSDVLNVGGATEGEYGPRSACPAATRGARCGCDITMSTRARWYSGPLEDWAALLVVRAS